MDNLDKFLQYTYDYFNQKHDKVLGNIPPRTISHTLHELVKLTSPDYTASLCMWQKHALDYFDTKNKIALVTARRMGLTSTLSAIAYHHAYLGKRVIVITPSRAAFKYGFIDNIMKLSSHFRDGCVKSIANTSVLKFDFSGGSISNHSHLSDHSFRGHKIDTIIVDNSKLISYSLVDDILSTIHMEILPRNPNCKIIVANTGGGYTDKSIIGQVWNDTTFTRLYFDYQNLQDDELPQFNNKFESDLGEVTANQNLFNDFGQIKTTQEFQRPYRDEWDKYPVLRKYGK